MKIVYAGAPEFSVAPLKKLLEEEMSGAVSLAVPMVAEAGVGENWYLAKG